MTLQNVSLMGARALAAALLLATCVASDAAYMNWGDVSDPAGSVVFEQVTEDNDEATTLFAPEAIGPSAVGDRLVLSPVGFGSGSNGSADYTDSTLRTTIAAVDGAGILSVVIDEYGDYSLGGLPGGAANASVGAAFFWRVLQVNGAPVAMPLQMASLSVSGGGVFSRPADDGTAVGWTGTVLLDVAAHLAEQQVDGQATRVELVFDNTLQTAADAVSTAFIKKKGVEITVETAMPEPASLAAAALGLVLAAAGRRG